MHEYNTGDNKNNSLIFSEEFETYEVGRFSEEISAIRENHYIEKQINQGAWTVISTYHTDRKPGKKIPWIITEHDNRKVIKQNNINKEGIINYKYFIKKYLLRRDIAPLIFFPAMVAGKEYWRDYKIDVSLIPLSKDHYCGVIFRALNSMQHYMFVLRKNKAYLIKREFNSLSKLKVKRHAYHCDKEIKMSIHAVNDEIRCFIDNKEILIFRDSSFLNGKCGIMSNVPAIFKSFHVYMDQSKNKKTDDKDKPSRAGGGIKDKYPGMCLIKKIDLHSLCTGRSIRFGGLTDKKIFEYLVVKGIHPKNDKNKKIFLSAVDSNGAILWQKGEPGKEKNIYPPDVPVQIYDIDNDGNNEVICEFGNHLQILDGKTGNIKFQIDSPRLLFDKNPSLAVLDSIHICNISGKPRSEDILVKDMYSNIYAYDNNLNMLWSYQCNTGHYPFTLDINGDGKDEILIGYTLLNSKGEKKWDLKLKDHADAVAIIKSEKTNDYTVAIAASNEGLILSDISGHIFKHLRIGHMQTLTVANLVPDSKEYQIASNTFWGNPGVIYILDLKGNIINVFQPSIYGSPLSPVRWTNERCEYILLTSASGKKGGLYNGYGHQAASFPEDGHPNLCNHVFDIDNDGLDEIICWDHERLWIYRSEEKGKSNSAKPIRYPAFFNQSNYRSNLSF